MLKMGWSGSSGLGRVGSGRVEPIEADVTQRRRQGLGFIGNMRYASGTPYIPKIQVGLIIIKITGV